MRDERPELLLHEQVMLLALRDETGTVESRAGWLSLTLGGAVLAELVLAGRVRIDPGRKALVEPGSGEACDDPVLNAALERVAASRRRRSATAWVQTLSRMRRLRHRVAEGLCRRGILRHDEDTVLLLFTREVYPTLDRAPERRLVQRIRRAVLEDGPTVDPRVAVLVSLAHATGLLRVVLTGKELRARKGRLNRIAEGDVVARAAREAVQAARTAAVVAAISASAAS